MVLMMVQELAREAIFSVYFTVFEIFWGRFQRLKKNQPWDDVCWRYGQDGSHGFTSRRAALIPEATTGLVLGGDCGDLPVWGNFKILRHCFVFGYGSNHHHQSV